MTTRNMTTCCVCGAESLSAAPQLMKAGETGDVVMWLDPNEVYRHRSNVPDALRLSDEFNWGFMGTGPLDFADNILFHFTKGNREFSRKHRGEFVRDILAPLPMDQAARTPEAEVSTWIEERTLNNPDATASLH